MSEKRLDIHIVLDEAGKVEEVGITNLESGFYTTIADPAGSMTLEGLVSTADEESAADPDPYKTFNAAMESFIGKDGCASGDKVVMLVSQANKGDEEEILDYLIVFESLTAAMAWVEFNTETTDANIKDWRILYGYTED